MQWTRRELLSMYSRKHLAGLRSLTSRSIIALKNEAKIIQKLQLHRNIVEFKFVSYQQITSYKVQFKVYHDHAFLGLERVQGVTLSKYIKRQKAAMGGRLLENFNRWEEQCAAIMNQIIQGVNHFHSKKYLHRDIKPLNIIICEE